MLCNLHHPGKVCNRNFLAHTSPYINHSDLKHFQKYTQVQHKCHSHDDLSNRGKIHMETYFIIPPMPGRKQTNSNQKNLPFHFYKFLFLSSFYQFLRLFSILSTLNYRGFVCKLTDFDLFVFSAKLKKRLSDAFKNCPLRNLFWTKLPDKRETTIWSVLVSNYPNRHPHQHAPLRLYVKD